MGNEQLAEKGDSTDERYRMILQLGNINDNTLIAYEHIPITDLVEVDSNRIDWRRYINKELLTESVGAMKRYFFCYFLSQKKKLSQAITQR